MKNKMNGRMSPSVVKNDGSLHWGRVKWKTSIIIIIYVENVQGEGILIRVHDNLLSHL
jgi:hypothetical protein